MDDVDKIVLSSLKEIGFEIKNEILNLKLCPFDDMVEMAIYCLNTIKPDYKFPSRLPPAMSTKFNMCAQLATVCKELGYKGDVGYHTFLYTNTTDIRNVLIFLVQLLPRQVTFEETEKNKSKKCVTLRQKTVEELEKALKSKSNEYYGMCRTPFISTSLETGTLLPNQKIDCQPLEWRNFVAEKLPFIDEQITDYQYFLPSLISLNTSGVLNPKKPKCSSFTFKPLEETFFSSASSRGQFDNAQNNTFSQLPAELPGSQNDDNVTSDSFNKSFQSEDLSETDDEAERSNIETEIRIMRENISDLNSKLNTILKSNNELKKSLEEKFEKDTGLDTCLQLLPDAETNIPVILASNEKLREKIKVLENKWETDKKILLSKRDERNMLIQNAIELRKELFNIAEQIEQRNVVEQKLTEKELKGVQRNEYIQRILEIIKNIKKQGVQIDQILDDMRYVQREINTLSGKINRSFALAEQMIVSNSRNDEFSQRTHKLLLTLHKDVSDILTMTGEIGNYSREAKDLEEQLQSFESSENISDSFNQVRNDLKRIREENVSLFNQVLEIEHKHVKPAESPPVVEKVKRYGDGDMDDEEFERIVDEDFGYPFCAELRAKEAAERRASGEAAKADCSEAGPS